MYVCSKEGGKVGRWVGGCMLHMYGSRPRNVVKSHMGEVFATPEDRERAVPFHLTSGTL